MTGWNEFIHWAERLVESVDLARHERDYKLVQAGKMKAAIEACVAESEDWPTRLKRGVGRGNLLDQYSQTRLGNVIAEQPEVVRRAVVHLAESGVDGIDAFADSLRALDDGFTPGSLTNLAALVLSGLAPGEFPPYKARFVADWASRVGLTFGDAPSERYGALLSLCDQMVDHWGDRQPPLGDRLDAQGLAWVVLKYDVFTWAPVEQSALAGWRAGTSQAVPRGEGVAPDTERAAWTVLGAGLRGETSVFLPGVVTWTDSAAGEIRDRLSHNPAGGSFMEKLHEQFSNASQEVIALLAELLFIRNAPLSDMGDGTKKWRVNQVLGWGDNAELPPELASSLDGSGSFRGGMGYHSRAAQQIDWLARFVQHWLSLSDPERAEALEDPFAFREVTASTGGDVPTIRYAVEYLAWPGWFAPIVSADHRTRIHQTLMGDLSEPTGSDDRSVTRDLVALRKYHESKVWDPRLHWYQSPYIERWQGTSSPAPRAWHIRVGEAGKNLASRWRDDSFISLSASRLGEISPGASQSEVRAVVRDGYSHLDRAQQEATSRAYWDFLTAMKEDDLVVSVVDGVARIGSIIGGAEFVSEDGSRLRREMQWSPAAHPVTELPDPVPALLGEQGQVVDITDGYDLLAQLVDHEAEEELPTKEPATGPVPETKPPLPPVTQALADELFMDAAPLQEIVDLLGARQQVVLFGPPGTGKTFVARHLAEHLVSDPGHVRLVQFHPSYSYEDFFEGFRPYETDSGQPGFELQPGPLKSIADDASKARGEIFVLIIDEMNRANLAKVFGELYFLLEYRKENVQLQYRPGKPFRLPPNLFIIGTMNTADRSIALVDAAIRRRFPFYEMHPSRPPIADVLRRFAKRREVADDRVDLLAALNRAMGSDGHDLHIGPSYFMRPEVSQSGGIERVWKYDIMPLLEEHFYGLKTRELIHEEFGLDSLRASLKSSQPVAALDSDEPADEAAD